MMTQKLCKNAKKLLFKNTPYSNSDKLKREIFK